MRRFFSIRSGRSTSVASERIVEIPLGDSATHDRYFKFVLANTRSARLFFETFLPKKMLKRIDLSTLEPARTRLGDKRGGEVEGDLFYIVRLKKRRRGSARRAVLMIVLEHKSERDRYVSIQLLKYVASLLDYMSENPAEFLDEDGLLPIPYPMVFSQDRRVWKEIPYLRRVVSWIDGFRKCVPDFWFQTIEVQRIPLETIRNSEALLRGFLYLEQIARTEWKDEEDQELRAVFAELLKAKNPDERLRQGVVASLRYMRYLKRLRPKMLTVEKLFDEIGEYDERSIDEDMESSVREFFPKYFARAEEKGRSAELTKNIYKFYGKRFGTSVSTATRAQIDALNDYAALERIQDVLWGCDVADDFNAAVSEIANSGVEVAS